MQRPGQDEHWLQSPRQQLDPSPAPSCEASSTHNSCMATQAINASFDQSQDFRNRTAGLAGCILSGMDMKSGQVSRLHSLGPRKQLHESSLIAPAGGKACVHQLKGCTAAKRN